MEDLVMMSVCFIFAKFFLPFVTCMIRTLFIEILNHKTYLLTNKDILK